MMNQNDIATMNETYAEESVQTSQKTMRDVIMAIEKGILELPDAAYGEHPNCKITNEFCSGVYKRKMEIKGGHYITGKIHIHEHFVVLLEGEIIVITEQGGYQHLQAPLDFISPAGVKRAAFCVTDTTWITYHSNPTNEKDLEVLEKINIAKDFKQYDKLNKMGSNNIVSQLTDKQ